VTIGATTSFQDSRDDVISAALENVGALAPGAARDNTNSQLFEAGAKALNRIVKRIDTTGKRLWRTVRRTATMTAGVDTVTLVSDVLLVDDPARYVRSGETSGLQVLAMSRNDYMTLADRTTAGPSRQFFFEQTLGGSTLKLWPVPDQTNDTLEYVAYTRAADFTTGADTPDFPAEWSNCLVYALTVELAPKFMQTGLIDTFKTLYESELAGLVNNDGERGNLVLVPWGMYSSGGGAG
jgi:hypothetical protein